MQLESTYSSFTLAVDKLRGTVTQLEFSAGSWNIAGPLADNLAEMSTVLLPFLLLMSYWFIYRRTKPGNLHILDICKHSLLVVAVVLITSKILSPQYLIWLIPLITLVLASTNEFHGLVWSNITIVSNSRFSVAEYEHGIFFYVHLAYS